MLVLAIAEDFDKLLQNSSLAPVASLGKLGGVVIVTVDIRIMLIVAILGAENSRAEGAGEMVDVVLSIKRSDV